MGISSKYKYIYVLPNNIPYAMVFDYLIEFVVYRSEMFVYHYKFKRKNK